MTNVEIVEYEKELRGIEEDCYTFNEWKKAGYMVKKGEHAVIKTKLWKKSMKVKTVKDEEGNTVEIPSGFYLANANLFSRDQVEKIASN